MKRVDGLSYCHARTVLSVSGAHFYRSSTDIIPIRLIHGFCINAHGRDPRPVWLDNLRTTVFLHDHQLRRSQPLSVLKTTLQNALGWTDVDYGWITFAFTVAYAAFPSLVGQRIDRYRREAGSPARSILWSAMAAAHVSVGTVVGFAIVRFMLGWRKRRTSLLAIKAVAMWFPQQERAFAPGSSTPARTSA